MIIPALLENRLHNIQKKLELLKDASPILHIDIGDGLFVELRSEFDITDLNSISGNVSYQIHLMCLNPDNVLETKDAHITSVIFHIEAVENYLKTAKYFKQFGYEVGVCVNIETPAPQYLENIDFIQFMSVIPGRQHNKFERSIVQKIHSFHRHYPEVLVQVDGGITDTNIPELRKAGASNFVVGSFILNSENPIQTYRNLCGI